VSLTTTPSEGVVLWRFTANVVVSRGTITRIGVGAWAAVGLVVTVSPPSIQVTLRASVARVVWERPALDEARQPTSGSAVGLEGALSPSRQRPRVVPDPDYFVWIWMLPPPMAVAALPVSD
jgi:hypothetical protein